MKLSGMLYRYRELIVYCMIGCSGASLDFVAYAMLTSWAGVHYQLANFLSVSIGIVNNFFWNYFFNFKTKDHMLIRLGSFYVIGMFGCALSAICLWLFIEKLGLGSLISKLATIFLVTVVQFCLNKHITFKKRGCSCPRSCV